jgi:hypothetical protein
MKDEKTIVIDINLNRGLVALLTLALLMAAFLGYLAWNQGAVAASGPQAPAAASTGMRQYYLTTTFHNGANALAACASGYHMASLWEILDPSNLKYNTDLGHTRDDSGQGPPTNIQGWVRTGYASDTSTTAGQANCNAWTSSESSVNGTRAFLPPNWTVVKDIHVWTVWTFWCDFGFQVWCVED